MTWLHHIYHITLVMIYLNNFSKKNNNKKRQEKRGCCFLKILTILTILKIVFY